VSGRWLAAAQISTSISAATKLAELYGQKGLPCEIEAAADGVIVYARDRVTADRVASDIRRFVATRDSRACTERAKHDEDEPSVTAWWSAVRFDWRKF
jgi:hypothetical protein